jgi:cysteine-S-conjugate beta-lyase
MADRALHDDTLLTHAGSRPLETHGVVNPPVYRASTVLFPTIEAYDAAYRNRFAQTTYGRYGTPTTFALEEAVAALEGGGRVVTLPSGLAAVSATLFALVKTGDHLLMADSVYGPVRALCERMLAGFGIETTFYDPLLGERIDDLIRPNTRLVYTESPGSLTFEVQDVPAIAAAAHARGALVVMDNTWATPLGFKAFAHGVDIVIHAATKYIVGHADVMLGLIACREEHYDRIKTAAHAMGYGASPDDCYLALRGLRTLSVRLARHQETALRLIDWLTAQPEVERVLYPALPGDPGHALWRRDFALASGLFGVLLRPCSPAAVAALVDRRLLFGIGSSWGGYESLMILTHPERARSATRWSATGPLLRVHAGLEDPRDLIADLEAGFAGMRAAA